MVVQEERRLKNQINHSINLVGREVEKGIKIKANSFKKGKTPSEVSPVNKKKQKLISVTFATKLNTIRKYCNKSKS